MKGVISDIAAERQRQIDKEGWSHEHDDAHQDGSIPLAAAAYTLAAVYPLYTADSPPSCWPPAWAFKWWKPKDQRQNLVVAGALIVAEIERLDRLALKETA